MTNPTAHAATRDCIDVLSALAEMTAHPNAITESDREVLAYRLRALNSSCAPLVRSSVVTVRPTNPRSSA
ncbi:MAG: hypothetical protein ACREXT_05030 [Gammaproteobacteria bacterium]